MQELCFLGKKLQMHYKGTLPELYTQHYNTTQGDKATTQ